VAPAGRCSGSYVGGTDVDHPMEVSLMVKQGEDLCARSMNDAGVMWTGFKP
jgi:hypothetical protein